MGAVMITGMSGAGKSALARLLAARGARAVDADDDPLLAWWVDEDGVAVTEAGTDAAWLARHRWEWNPDRLDAVIAAAGAQTLFVCGSTANDMELWDRFARVYLLVVDEPTMLARLDDPRRDNDFGRSPDERALLREWLPGFHAACLARGAVPVDASLPLERVADAILAAEQGLAADAAADRVAPGRACTERPSDREVL